MKPLPEAKQRLKENRPQSTVMIAIMAKLCIIVLRTFFWRTRPP